MNKKELQNTLKERRTEAGFTQQALADAISVSRKTINTIENSVFIPSTVLALKLSNALDCKVEDIFQLSDDSETNKS